MECLERRAVAPCVFGKAHFLCEVVTPDDAKVVEVPAGRWRDDLGEIVDGPRTIRLENIPLERLPRYERQL